MYCPICRKGAKHVANLECLERFWRPVLPRKLKPEYLTRLPVFYEGTNLFAIYRNEELGYAVGCYHFALAMITLTGITSFFWKHVIDFLEQDMKVRPEVPLVRKVGLLMHIIESLAWKSSDGELFPTPLIVWYLLDGFLIRHKELHDLLERITVKEYTPLSC